MIYYFKIINKMEWIVLLFFKYISLHKLLFLFNGKNWLTAKIGKNFTCLNRYLISINSSLEIGDNVRIQAEEINLGKNVYIGHNNYLYGRITIGNDFMSGPNVSIMGGNHGYYDTNISMVHQKCSSIGIVIENDVWIGANSVILDGVKIASHCIIGAGSVVIKDTEEWCVYVGNPARKVKKRI